MKKLWVVLLISLTIPFVTCGVSLAGVNDAPFNRASNYGISGLMTIPNARVMRKYTYRIGISYVLPYVKLYGTFSPIKNLELNGVITDIRHVKGFANHPGYGDYKDKDIDFKCQILQESKWLPAIAIGGNDLIGTRLYASQYIVASKQIWPFDFTIGMGNGRFGKKQLGRSKSRFAFEMLQHPIRWFKNSYLFGGIEFVPSNKYAFMVEYSPIRYSEQTKDPAWKEYFQKPVKSRINFGFRWRPKKWIEIDVSYQRGRRIGVNLTMNFNIGKPMIPIYYPEYVEPLQYRKYPFVRRLILALSSSGFSNIQVVKTHRELFICAQNNRYFYPTRAIGVIIGILEKIKPPKDYKVHIILENNLVPMVEFDTSGRDVAGLANSKLTENEFLYLSRLKTSEIHPPNSFVYNRTVFSYGLKPSVQTFLNDPSGFFKYRAGVSLWGTYFPWKGGSLFASVGKYFINTISTVNKPLSIPVSSDFVEYEKQKLNVNSLLFNQVVRVKSLFLRGAVGWLDTEYAGFDGEVAVPLWDGRVFVGVGGSVLKKRSPYNLLGLREKERGLKRLYLPFFFKTRFNLFKRGIYIDLKLGRFLAGDVGGRLQVSKDINGVILSAWYSVTNTSIFHDPYNRGYHDYGVSVSIPLRLFLGRDSKTVYYYSLSPWTRDVAQDISHYDELFNYMEKYQPLYLYDHGYEMFKTVEY